MGFHFGSIPGALESDTESQCFAGGAPRCAVRMLGGVNSPFLRVDRWHPDLKVLVDGYHK